MANIVIFGASGDLTRRKLVPALFHLFQKNHLPADFCIVGYARSTLSANEFRQRMRSGVEAVAHLDDDAWQAFSKQLHYVQGSYDDSVDLSHLDDTLKELGSDAAGRLYYLSTPPKLYADIVQGLGAAEMVDEEIAWRRVVIEKPFGHDLASAKELNRKVHCRPGRTSDLSH